MNTPIRENSFVRKFLRAIIPVAVLASATPVYANSVITWSPPQNISADSDVSTAGRLVGAFNLGAPQRNVVVDGHVHQLWPVVSDTTVNGVTFVGLPVNGLSVTAGTFTLSGFYSFGVSGDNAVFRDGPFGLSASYKALISSDVSTAVGSGFTLTISGLEAGAEYQFQWWSNDNWGDPTGTTASDSFNFESGSPSGNRVGFCRRSASIPPADGCPDSLPSALLWPIRQYRPCIFRPNGLQRSTVSNCARSPQFPTFRTHSRYLRSGYLPSP
jgi:hypothetical protein